MSKNPTYPLRNGLRQALLLLAAMLATALPTQAQRLDYTEERPLVIICDWEFPPYEFINTSGQPDGYNVELLHLILKRLEIPHRFDMQEWTTVVRKFHDHEADLVNALAYNYMTRPYIMTHNLTTYYNLKTIRRTSTPAVTRLADFTPEDTVILKNLDYADYRINGERKPVFAIEYHSTKEAITGIRTGRYKYFIWGELPLAQKIRELNIDSVTVDDIDIPSGEIRLIGYDKEIIDLIDDEYARLEQAGEIDQIRDKWFHPERAHNDSSPYSLLLIGGIALFVVILLLMIRLLMLRIKSAVRQAEDQNHMMELALSMGENYVVEYDVEAGRLRNVYGNLLPADGMTFEEFVGRISPGEQGAFRAANNRLLNGETQQINLKKLWNAGTPAQPRWRHLAGNAIAETHDHQVRYIVNTVKDITREVEEEAENLKLSLMFQQIFDTNLIAMSFYNKDGQLIDLNENMKSLIGVDETSVEYFRTHNMFDMDLVSEFNRESREPFHVCQHMYYPEVGLDKYVEFKIRPTCDDNGRLIYYIITARDITDERTMYLDQRRHDRELRQANASNNQYERQLRYLLENADMLLWRYDVDHQQLVMSRSLEEVEYTETLEEYFEGMYEEDRPAGMALLKNNMEEGLPFNAIHHFRHTPVTSEPAWFAISGAPIANPDGDGYLYFGTVRNITSLMDAQQRLREETARAEDSGRMKAAFLANMTHEIRTPLNAIVGFSDLLQVIDEPEERMEFIRIIRNNCDMLLRLINDILEASTPGQALAIEPADCDFSQVFDDICQTLAQRVQEPGVEFIKDNPYPTFPAHLDKGRIQQVLTNFTTNAVKYTHEGHIRVGYRSQDGGIYFYCEDTGAGIPKEKQPSVFERFVKLNDYVQGTGLGLSICKSIAERCGGKIGVTSEGEGHGSTFWMWIPQQQQSEKQVAD